MNTVDKRRAKLVIAMDEIARSLNDENILESWLMCGVADGDIDENTSIEDVIEMGYTDDDTYPDIERCFLRCMSRAYKNESGLCI